MVEISANCFVLLSGSWSFWDVGIFEELVVFLRQIFALSRKIDSKYIPVLSRMNFSLDLVSVSEELQRFNFFLEK